MNSAVQIALVAGVAGAACALAGVFLVLRRMAMMADAISHAILPGLVGGYILARGPNVLVGFLGASAAGLATVALVEALTRSRRVKGDTAIGLVFPTLFALGVLVISKFLANVHIDTDAVLYGEIAFAPFDTLRIAGRSLGPRSLWTLGGLAVVNAIFLIALYKELKLSTFDAGLAAALGFLPGVLHYLLMGMVAVTTVGAFAAVGAILAVALIVVPPVCASMLTRRLPLLIGLSLLIGTGSAVLGYLFAAWANVSISGMIATTLGLVFGIVLLIAPGQGLAAQWFRRRRQRVQFAAEVLVVHLATHAKTPHREQESTLLHIERELGWPSEKATQIVRRAEGIGLLTSRDGSLTLTAEGESLASMVAAR